MCGWKGVRRKERKERGEKRKQADGEKHIAGAAC